jgi:hypothetical protein
MRNRDIDGRGMMEYDEACRRLTRPSLEDHQSFGYRKVRHDDKSTGDAQVHMLKHIFDMQPQQPLYLLCLYDCAWNKSGCRWCVCMP